MASANSTFSFPLFFIFLLVVQDCSAVKLIDDPLESSPILAFRPKANSPRVDIEIGKITKALWDSGFKIISLMLERNLKAAIPYQDFQDGSNSSISLYNNQVITIFVPDTDCYRHDFRCQDLGYQIVASKVDKKLLTSVCSENAVHGLATFDGTSVFAHFASYSSRGENGEYIEHKRLCINNVEITNWHIYNDGHVIVHGVSGFFNRKAGDKIHMSDVFNRMAGHKDWTSRMNWKRINDEKRTNNNLFWIKLVKASTACILSLLDVAQGHMTALFYHMFAL